jgi:hypothetical protein
VSFLTVRSCQLLPGTAAGTSHKGEVQTGQKVKLAALLFVTSLTFYPIVSPFVRVIRPSPRILEATI